jgi:hypothetical protein
MAHKELFVALGMMLAMPAVAAQPEPNPEMGAPAAGPDAKYCMHVELTGNVIEPVKCWTREQWAEQGVDVDKEWAKEGVAVKG